MTPQNVLEVIVLRLVSYLGAYLMYKVTKLHRILLTATVQQKLAIR